MRKGIFIATNAGYQDMALALIASIRVHVPEAEVTLLCGPDVKPDISDRRVRVIPMDFARAVVDNSYGIPANGNLLIKQLRYLYLSELCGDYDAACLLDADMLVVSPQFERLFEMVAGSRVLVGCNEAFKWRFGPRYRRLDVPLFDSTITAHRFCCNVPIVFDPQHWQDVFQRYNQLAYHAYEWEGDKPVKRVGDIYCWNLSVYLEGRQDDVLLWPMQQMTQVHHTNLREWARLKKADGRWFTPDGDEVLTLHGRFNTPNYLPGERRAATKQGHPENYADVVLGPLIAEGNQYRQVAGE